MELIGVLSAYFVSAFRYKGQIVTRQRLSITSALGVMFHRQRGLQKPQQPAVCHPRPRAFPTVVRTGAMPSRADSALTELLPHYGVAKLGTRPNLTVYTPTQGPVLVTFVTC